MQNKNTSRPNNNTLYIARSGGGKSQALIQNASIPHSGARVLLYDPNEDHPWTIKFDSIERFKKAAVSACKQWYKNKRGFRLAYVGEQSTESHERWCEIVCSLLDGNHETYVLDEEISLSCESIARAEFHHRMLMNQGRKFGGNYHGTTQRPQEIPKTVFEQCEKWYVGGVSKSLAKRLSDEMGINYVDLMNQEPLSFYVKDSKSFGFTAKHTQLAYKDPDTVKRSNRIHIIK